MNQTHKIKITALSPLHIGSGHKISPFEYVLEKDNKNNVFFKRFYHANLSEILDMEKIKSFNYDAMELRKYIAETLESEGKNLDLWYQAKVDKDAKFKEKIKENEREITIYDKYLENINNLKQGNETNALEINEFIGSAFGKYIPGSSIKGAIRTAILNSEGGAKFEEKIQNVFTNKDKKHDEYKNQSPFQNLMITDTDLFTDRIKVGIAKRGMSQLLEYVPPESEFDAKVIFKKAKLNKDKIEIDFSREFIMDCCQNYTKTQVNYLYEQLQKTNQKLNKSGKSEADNIRIEINNEILKQMKELGRKSKEIKNGFVLNLGWGGGGLFKTFDKEKGGRNLWISKKDDSKNPIPKTQWLINGKVMGWVLVEFVD